MANTAVHTQSVKVTAVSVNDGLITVTTATGEVIETGRDNTAGGGKLDCYCGASYGTTGRASLASSGTADMVAHISRYCPRLHGDNA